MKIGMFGFSGSAGTEAKRLAFEAGRQVALHGCIAITGATTGLPYEAAKGAKKEHGVVIGISPASSKDEHVQVYKMPLDYHDAVLFTGFGYNGRNVINVRSSDAAIIMGGSAGTLNEFTIAYSEGKPIGVLVGTGGITSKIRDLIKSFPRKFDTPIFFSKDPKKLVEKLVELAKKN